jgi:hypothetical protein
MVFEMLLLIGAVGMVLMTVLGVSRGVGHIGGHSGHALGHVHTTAHVQPLGHGAHAHGVHQGPTPQNQTSPLHVQGNLLGLHANRSFFSYLPTPIDILSMCVGAGLTGILLRHILASPLLWIAVIAGALVFDLAIVRPIFSALLNFASKPSAGLEGMVALDAEAVSRFDESGRGIVRVNMEGLVVQLLAHLEPDEVGHGAVVQKGDRVIVTEVNAKSNTCRVSRELSI